MIDQGCASGLAGTANNNTAEAPIGATSNGMFALDPSRKCVTAPVNAIPINAPTHERKRFRHSIAIGGGAKRASQRVTAERGKMIGAGGWVKWSLSSEIKLHETSNGVAAIMCDCDIKMLS
jgi:hypothetical protein